MWRHYVYVHRRASDGRVFYVGKGSSRDRAIESSSRNQHWRNVVAKHGRTIEVVARFETDALAQQCERDLIAWFGRSALVNMTDGGDGRAGLIASESTRQKLSAHAKKPRNDAWVKSIRKARAGGGNGGVVKTGDKLPDAWRKNIAATKVGALNPMHGRTGDAHPRSRRVVDADGTVYPSVTAAARALGTRMQTLHNMLTGFRPNNSTMRFAP